MSAFKWLFILSFLFSFSIEAEVIREEQGSKIQDNEQKISLNLKEKQYLFLKKNISMCVDPDWMPFEKIQDGRHVGMSADYISLIQHWVGIPFRLVVTASWQQSLLYAEQRKCDILSAVMSTPDRATFLNFTQPYMDTPLVIVTNVEELFIDNIEDILHKPLGVVQGYAFNELLRIKYPNIILSELSSISEGLQQVEAGKLYGFMGSLASISYTFQNKNYQTLKISGKFDERWYLGIGVRNDERMLLDILEKAVAKISGKDKNKIFQHWVAVKQDEELNYKLIGQLIAGFVVIVLLLLYRYFILLQSNKQLNQAHEKIELQNQLLSKLAITDKLTQLYNRAKLDEMLGFYQNLCERYHEHFCIILMDIDNFKQVNDNFGHAVGDQVLTTLATILKNNIRANDIFGRWGGEEFMVICPVTDLQGCKLFAEQLRMTVAEHKMDIAGNMTISLGVAEYHTGEKIASLINRADRALYRAKAEGRNSVAE